MTESTDRAFVEQRLETQEAELASLRAQVAQLTAAGHQLINTQTRMQSLLHRATDAIIQYEADGTVSSFNSAAERIFDYAEIELLHQRGVQLFDLPADYAGDVPQYLLAYSRDTADQSQTPLVGRRRDGSAVLLEVSVAEIAANDLILFDDFSTDPTNDSSSYEAFLCILRDVTERKRIDEELRRHREELEQLVEEQVEVIRAAKEDAERANQAKSEFLAQLSHELRTPMHAILSYSEFGLKKTSSAPQEKIIQYFERIKGAGSRLLCMINDLLDLAKAEAGSMRYNFEEHDIDAMIREILTEYEGLAAQRSLTVCYACNIQLKRTVFDLERLGQVIRNLLSNAFKFSPLDGTVRVTVHDAVVSTEGEDQAAISIRVSDSGMGIPEDELEAVFDRFVQSSRSSGQSGGTGLGLAIAREIVLAHGGCVSACNNPDGGACFDVLIPRRLQSA